MFANWFIEHVLLLAPPGALVVIAFLITQMVHFFASGSVSTFPIYVVFLVTNFFLFNFSSGNCPVFSYQFYRSTVVVTPFASLSGPPIILWSSQILGQLSVKFEMYVVMSLEVSCTHVFPQIH